MYINETQCDLSHLFPIYIRLCDSVSDVGDVCDSDVGDSNVEDVGVSVSKTVSALRTWCTYPVQVTNTSCLPIHLEGDTCMKKKKIT